MTAPVAIVALILFWKVRGPFNASKFYSVCFMDMHFTLCSTFIFSIKITESFAVRHVVMHQGVVAPSKIEEFVTDCAVRDVFHKGINSQLPAFDCSMGSLVSCQS